MDARTSVEALAAVLSDAIDPAVIVGPDDVVVFANPASRGRWIVGRPAAAAYGVDREVYVRALAHALTGQSQRFEWGDRGPGGVRSWFAATLTPIRCDGELIGVACLSCDVTRLRRAEERLRRSEQLMVDTQGVAHLGIWEWDVNEPHAVWSDELYRIYGLTPETYTPTYEGYLRMVHDDDRQRVAEATQRVFQEHAPYSHDERIVRPDGELRYLHTWAYPELDDAGKLCRLIGVCQDITDRKLAEEQALAMARDLERRVEERTRTIENSMHDLEAFNAMVSHDLRAPLQVIQVGTQLLDQVLEQRPADGRKYLQRIQRAVGQMSSLVDALLALARIGSTPLERVEVDLTSIARDVFADLAATSPQRVVEVRVADGLRCRGDARLLRAVLQNLIGNAWKYSQGIALARIEVGQTERDGRRAFFVRDNGIGFASEDAQRLFQPFVRLPGAREFSGTGIGLVTVQRILERHGGSVFAESEPGRGATFVFTLPA